MAEIATVARPYAKALYAVAREKGKVGEWREQLAGLAAVAADEKVAGYLSSPEVGTERQGEAFLKLVESLNVEGELRNLINAMASNDRLSALGEVHRQFIAMADAEQSVQKAVIYTPYPIEDAQLESIVASIQKSRGVRIDPTVQIDRSLIGGLKIEFGDKVLDLSYKGRLEQLYASMKN